MNTMSEAYKNTLIKTLEKELDSARNISVEDIARSVQEIGFNCLICGKCCRREEADNTVVICPEEIEVIKNDTFLAADEITMPLLEEAVSDFDEKFLQKYATSIDRQGNIHTFGWRLCQKKNGDCKFIQDKREGERCTIYSARPMLCSTYPFHIEELELRTSECEGLGGQISIPESHLLAEELLKRYIMEIKDTILLYKEYEEFEQRPDALSKAIENLANGYINYVVHDSKGKKTITQNV